MNEEINHTTEEQNPEAPKKDEIGAKRAEKKKENPKSMEEAVKELSGGKLKLHKPFIADDVEITELYFNFENLTGIEMTRAMDRGAQNGGNAFRLSQEQALELFIMSAGKETKGCDAEDVRRGLSSVDAIKAVQLATVFFVASSQAGNAHITKS